MTEPALALSTPLTRQETRVLGMAQLAPRGISEDWWLKHLGDVHWQLIADAVGQNTTVFRDDQGRHLYAAFCATEVVQSEPDLVGLGRELQLVSELWAAGRSRIQSNHRLVVGGTEVARVRLVSTFVAHMQPGVNASIRRATPYLIPVLAPAPDAFAAETLAHAKGCKHNRPGIGPKAHLTPNFGNDFNAVGLLYFPSYTRLFEQTETLLSGGSPWTPIKRRRVLYFCNIEPGESVAGAQAPDGTAGFDLWTHRPEPSGRRLLATCSLSRF